MLSEVKCVSCLPGEPSKGCSHKLPIPFSRTVVDNAFAVRGKLEGQKRVLIHVMVDGLLVVDGIEVENQFVIEFANFKADDVLPSGENCVMPFAGLRMVSGEPPSSETRLRA